MKLPPRVLGWIGWIGWKEIFVALSTLHIYSVSVAEKISHSFSNLIFKVG
jgi:hypothetical protein